MIAWFWPFLLAFRSWRMRVQRPNSKHGKGGPAHIRAKKVGTHEYLGLDGPSVVFIDVPNCILTNLVEPESYTKMSAQDMDPDFINFFSYEKASQHRQARRNHRRKA